MRYRDEIADVLPRPPSRLGAVPLRRFDPYPQLAAAVAALKTPRDVRVVNAVVQGAAGKTAVCTDRSVVQQGGRTAAGGHVPEGETATSQVQDADEAADETDGKRPGTFRVSTGAGRRPGHGSGMVQGRSPAEARSVSRTHVVSKTHRCVVAQR